MSRYILAQRSLSAGNLSSHLKYMASGAFVVPEECSLIWLSGSTGLGGTSLLPQPVSNIVRDVNFLVAARDAIMAQPAHTAWFVITGPCTNAALLFATFPEVVDHLAG